MRSMPHRRGVVVGIVMASFLAFPAVPAVAADPGLIGISSRLQSGAGGSVTPTAGEHAAHPALAAVSVMAPWKTLEPTDGAFDWSQLDANVQDARANGYQLILRVMAGRMSPAWLMAPGMAQKVRVLGTDQNASDYCDFIDVPVPWDPVLQSQYTELMDAIGTWLDGSDGAGGRKADHVRLVPISMPTVLGSEMVVGYGGGVACPTGTDGAGLNLSGTNRAAWDAVGTETDRRSAVEAAWRTAIAIHMQELPADVASVIAYGAVFGDAQAAAQRIAGSEVAAYPDRLWSMYTNLQPQIRSDGSLGPWRNWCSRCHDVITTAIGAGGKVGFQTAAGSANDTLTKFRTAADDALATYGMRFLETQPPNIDRYQDYLLTGTDPLQERIRRALLPPPPPPEPHATATAVSCGGATVGVAGTCSATVSDVAAEPSPPTGTVTWTTTNGTVAGSCELGAGGSCSVALTPAATGAATVSATYAGTATHVASAAGTTIDVAARASATSVSCGGTVVLPASTTCMATVSDVTPGTVSAPSGDVAWSASGSGTLSATSCSLAAVSGSASRCTVTFTPSSVGTASITASFAGDATHTASASSATVTVEAPPPGDTVVPTVRITSPSSGATVRRGSKVTIAASASDNVRVANVVFSVNGVTLCTDTTSPWSCAWSVPKSMTGTVTLTARAADPSGNLGSHSINVTIR